MEGRNILMLMVSSEWFSFYYGVVSYSNELKCDVTSQDRNLKVEITSENAGKAYAHLFSCDLMSCEVT